MKRNQAPDLFVSSHWIILMGIAAALLAAQWHHEALPLVALVAVLILMVFKARLIILDFIGLRGQSPRLAMALIAWPMLFALAAVVKAAVSMALGL